MAEKRVVVLFPCVGRRVALVEAFRRACVEIGLSGSMIGTDFRDTAPALEVCDRRHLARRVADPGYGEEMAALVREEGVKLVVPTVDLDLAIWARLRGPLAEEGCTVLVSCEQVVEICQDKRKTFTFLREHGFATPQTWEPEEAIANCNGFPYFLKPRDGYASRGAYVAHDAEELAFYARRVPNCIVQEYVEGAEYSVDLLVDFAGRVRCAVPRRRLEVRAGEVSKAETVKHRGMMDQGRAIVEALGAGPGVVTLQCFLRPDGEIVFIELNPRFGGGAPLAFEAGADYPRWILELWSGRKAEIGFDTWREGLRMLRYDAAVWVEAAGTKSDQA